MFTNTLGKGFHMEFANGWRVSVQWGEGNYCDNRHGAEEEELEDGMLRSRSAEVLVISPKGAFGDVKGWLTTDQVAALIARVAKRKPLA